MIPGKIPGTIIQMGGQEWQVPPLTLGHFKRLNDKIAALSRSSPLDPETGNPVPRAMTPEDIDTLADIVASAMSRNYPDITPEKVLDLLDVGNARAVMIAVLSGSGLPQGEARAVANGAANGSMTPTDSSLPPATTISQQ